MTIKSSYARTLSVLRELAQGKTITLDGYEVSMAIDTSIGFITPGRATIGLGKMTLSQFHALLERNGIGPVIPGRQEPR